MTKFKAFGIIICVFLASTNIDGSLKCKSYRGMSDFQAKKGEGVWYTLAITMPGADSVGDCLKYNVTGKDNIITMSYRNNGEYVSKNLQLVQQADTSTFLLNSEPDEMFQYTWVNTDYTRYAIYRYCQKGEVTVDLSTRQRVPDTATVLDAMYALLKSGLITNAITMKRIEHSGCSN